MRGRGRCWNADWLWLNLWLLSNLRLQHGYRGYILCNCTGADLLLPRLDLRSRRHLITLTYLRQLRLRLWRLWRLERLGRLGRLGLRLHRLGLHLQRQRLRLLRLRLRLRLRLSKLRLHWLWLRKRRLNLHLGRRLPLRLRLNMRLFRNRNNTFLQLAKYQNCILEISPELRELHSKDATARLA